MQKLQITALCVDAQNIIAVQSYSAYVRRNSNIRKLRNSAYMRIDAQFSPLWSFPKFGRTQNRSTHRAEFLHIYANENFLEFLLICADFSSMKFVWTYAKSLHEVSAYVRK